MSVAVNTSVNTSAELAVTFNEDSEWICYLARIKELNAGPNITKPPNAAVSVISDAMEIYVHDVVDPEAELKRLNKQKKEVERAKNSIENKLNNSQFVNKAKPEVVNKAREKLAELTEKLESVKKHLSEFKS